MRGGGAGFPIAAVLGVAAALCGAAVAAVTVARRPGGAAPAVEPIVEQQHSDEPALGATTSHAASPYTRALQKDDGLLTIDV